MIYYFDKDGECKKSESWAAGESDPDLLLSVFNESHYHSFVISDLKFDFDEIYRDQDGAVYKKPTKPGEEYEWDVQTKNWVVSNILLARINDRRLVAYKNEMINRDILYDGDEYSATLKDIDIIKNKISELELGVELSIALSEEELRWSKKDGSLRSFEDTNEMTLWLKNLLYQIVKRNSTINNLTINDIS